MANAGAQHELVGVLINRYPGLALRLAEVAGVSFPGHDRAMAAPNTHQTRGRGQIATDATIHLLSGDRACHFAQIEMQREFKAAKLTTLRAYHGSEVRKTMAGGHMFVLSPKASVTLRFRAAEDAVGQALAFSVSYLSSEQLSPLAERERPFEERALAAALTDFENGISGTTVSILLEMSDHNDDVADLFFRAILEECADQTKLEEALSDLAMQRLQALPSFQRWLAGVTAQANEKAAEKVAEAAEKAAEKVAEAAEKVAEKVAEAQARGVVQSLLDYFSAKGDAPTLSAMNTMNACTDPVIAQYWLRRAYAGETAAQIFPDDVS
ncbi:MAG: hypothetical protein ACRDOI_00575 [Trebonia sp.]